MHNLQNVLQFLKSNPRAGATRQWQRLNGPDVGPAGLLFRFASFTLVIAATFLTIIEHLGGNNQASGLMLWMSFGYFFWALLLEYTARIYREAPDRTIFRTSRIGVNVFYISALVFFGGGIDNSFWCFFVLPFLQSVSYIRQRRLLLLSSLLILAAFWLAALTGSAMAGVGMSSLTRLLVNTFLLLGIFFVLYFLYIAAIATRNLAYFDALAAVQKIAASVNTPGKLQALLKELLRSVVKPVGANGARIFLWDDNQNNLVCKASILTADREDITTEQALQIALKVTDKQAAFLNHSTFSEPTDEPGWTTISTNCSVAAVPLLSRGQALGALLMTNRTKDYFNRDHLYLLRGLASYVGQIIEESRLLEEQQRQSEQNKLLNELAAKLNSTSTIDEILRFMLVEMISIFEVDQGGIAVIDEHRGVSVVNYQYPELGEDAKKPKIPLAAAICRWMYEHCEPLAIEDTEQAEILDDLRTTIRLPEIKSMLIVPLIVDGELFGTLGLDACHQARRFTEREKELAMTIANHISVALGRAQQFERVQEQLDDMKWLVETGAEIGSTIKLDAVLPAVARKARVFVDAKVVHVYQWRDESATLVHCVSLWRDGSLRQPPSPPRKNGLTQYVIETRTVQIIADTRQSQLFRSWHDSYGITGVVGLPMLYKKQLVGVINIAFDNELATPLTVTQLGALEIVASQAAAAIVNAELYQAIVDRSTEWQDLEHSAAALAKEADVSSVLQSIVEHTPDSCGADGVFVCLFDSEKEVFTPGLSASVGLGQGMNTLANDNRQPENLHYQIMKEGSGWILDLFPESAATLLGSTAHAKLKAAGIRAFIGVTLELDDNRVGLMAINFAEPITSQHVTKVLNILRIYADQAAVAIYRARDFERAQKEKDLRDVLAKLINAQMDVVSKGLNKVWETLLIGSMHLTRAENGSIGLLDRRKNIIVVQLIHGDRKHLRSKEFVLDDNAPNSITSWVAINKLPVLIHNWREDKKWRDIYFPADPDTISQITVPILRGDDRSLIGTINLESPREAAFSSQDSVLLESLAEIAAIAIQNAERFHITQKHSQQLEQALYAGQGIAALRPVNDLLLAITRSLVDIFGYDSVILFPYEKDRDEFGIPVISGQLYDIVKVQATVTDGSLVRNHLDAAAPAYFTSKSKGDKVVDGNFLAREKVTSSGYVRLAASGEEVGLLYVNSIEYRDFVDEEKMAVQLFANFAAIAIYNSRRYAELKRKQAQVDFALTAGRDQAAIESTTEERLLKIANELLKNGQDFANISLVPFDPERRTYGERVFAGQFERFDQAYGDVRSSKNVVLTRMQEGEDHHYSLDPAADRLLKGEFVERENLKAVASIRLKKGSQCYGLLFVNKHVCTPFDSDQRTAILLAAARLCEVISSAQLRRKMNDSLRYMQNLNTLSESELLEKLYERLCSLFEPDAIPSIFIYDNVERELRFLNSEPENFREMIDITSQKERVHFRLGEGIVGWVARERQAALVDDVQKDERYLALYKNTKSEIAVPILLDKELVGVIDVESPELGRFTLADRELLEAIGNNIARTLRNIRLFERRRRNVDALIEAARAIISPMERNEVLRAILEQAANMTNSYFATIQKLVEGKLIFEAVYPEECCKSLMTRLQEVYGRKYMTTEDYGITPWVALNEVPALISDVSESDRYVDGGVGATLAELAVPIMLPDGCWGILNVESVRRDAYDAEHQSVLVALADMAVAVLKKAEDERKTRRAMQVAMLGEMGANAQHDLNRQVGYIRRQVFLLRDKLKAIKAEPDLRNKIERGLVTIDKDASLLKKTHFPTVNIDVLQIPIPVHLVVENQLELLQANEPDVVFEYVPAHHHAQVRVAEVTLEMIINHLLQNAVRAASRGRNEQPKVSIRTWLPEPGQIVIEIADNGPGVREEFVEKLFYEPIRQIEGGIERISTGLMLVGMFAEAYGGKAWLKENQLGKGASFGLQFSTIDKTGHGIEGEI